VIVTFETRPRAGFPRLCPFRSGALGQHVAPLSVLATRYPASMSIAWKSPSIPGAATFAEWNGATFALVRNMPDGRKKKRSCIAASPSKTWRPNLDSNQRPPINS